MMSDKTLSSLSSLVKVIIILIQLNYVRYWYTLKIAENILQAANHYVEVSYYWECGYKYN